MGSKLSQSQQHLAKLFELRDGEGICVSKDAMGTEVQPSDYVYAALKEASEAPCFVSLNPLFQDRDVNPTKWYHRPYLPRRADHNVSAHRNILIEFDEGTQEEQVARLLELEVPYTTLVDSGGKSVHAVIALSEPLADKEDYVAVFQAINAVLPGMDPSCKNPSRFTRLAGAVRPETGRVQELLDVRNRVTRERLFRWLARYSDVIEAAEKRLTERRAEQVAANAEGVVKQETMDFLFGLRGTNGSRHARLYAAVCELRDCGYSYDEAMNKAESAAIAHGISLEPGRENEAREIVEHVYFGRR